VTTPGDDALGEDDAWTLRERLHRREVSPGELAAAARQRLARSTALNAVTCETDVPQFGDHDAPLLGIPTVIKDNENLTGYPTLHGSAAMPTRPATADSPWVAQYRDLGVMPIAKTTLPEFGLTASTESTRFGATRNPWNLDYSVGGSSGGSAALVAAGVVPIAHANDGGGSVRIPAAACGLVGMKTTRGRIIDVPELDRLPINLVTQGVVTRSVRDSALYLYAAEQAYRNPALPPIGFVRAPKKERLRIAVMRSSVRSMPIDSETLYALDQAAVACERLGHRVDVVPHPMPDRFADDFLRYWALLGGVLAFFGGRMMGTPDFDGSKVEVFTRGLGRLLLQQLERVPGALRRLKVSAQAPVPLADAYDVVLSPVLSHPAPRIGELGPDVPFRTHLARLVRYSCFTPLANITGAPALSLPIGRTSDGRPIGVQACADRGREATLLSLGYELEEALPWPRIAPPVTGTFGGRS
jgi:amidase